VKSFSYPVSQKSFSVQDQFTSINEEWFSHINSSENLPTTNVRLQGYFLNKLYFAHVDDQLRHDFTFSADVMRQAQSILEVFDVSSRKANVSSTKTNGYARVVIHVRRGDYNGLVDESLKRDTTFFRRSMGYFADCLPTVHFIVISDDISWCRNNLKSFGYKVDFVDGERSPGVDLAIASLCDHAILTHGTFGTWVAWFANGLTVALTPD
jgi:galactoside 2-L-fucosyltransferase 1/2